MKTSIIPLLFLLLSGSWLADAGAKPHHSGAKTTPVILVAVSSPPLEVQTHSLGDRQPAAHALVKDAILTADYLALEKSLYLAPGGVLTLGRIAPNESGTRFDPPLISDRGPRPYEGHIWSASREVSETLAQALRNQGVEARVWDRYLPLSPSRPTHLPDWRASVLQWYATEQSDADYRHAGIPKGTDVIEVAVGDVSVFHGQIRLTLLAKRIDPVSGEVKARASGRETASVRAEWQLFDREARAFKSAIRDLGRGLAEQTLPPLTARF
ncbi:MAG: hypothetical protein ACPW60_14510 [Methylohalobius sp. ZOD2]